MRTPLEAPRVVHVNQPHDYGDLVMFEDGSLYWLYEDWTPEDEYCPAAHGPLLPPSMQPGLASLSDLGPITL